MRHMPGHSLLWREMLNLKPTVKKGRNFTVRTTHRDMKLYPCVHKTTTAVVDDIISNMMTARSKHV